MKYLLTVAAAVAFAGSAVAQTPPANPDPKTPAVTQPSTPGSAMPAKGANSFSEGQAKKRIEEKGFSGVTGLMKDNDGVWRGKAMKNGASHDVALDYQGTVFPK